MKAKSNSKISSKKSRIKSIKVKTTSKAGWFWDQNPLKTLADTGDFLGGNPNALIGKGPIGQFARHHL